MLGQVSEDDGKLLHIVIRMEMELEETRIDSVSVISMTQADDQKYYLMIDEKARGLVAALEKRFAE